MLSLILIVILSIALGISLYYNWKFGKAILGLEDAIEESLDILDKRYEAMSLILKKPVFFDSQEVRQVIKEITVSRESILRIANLLVGSVGGREVEFEEEDREDQKV
jgi:hypothetical protein